MVTKALAGGAVSLTVTSTLSESVALLPSVTVTVMVCTPTWPAVGVQENTPAGVMDAPVGGVPASENVKVSAIPLMMSPSEAEAVNVSDSSLLTLLGPMGSSTGDWFTSATVTVMDSESVAPTPSRTCMVMVCVPSCDSEGVQENAPPDVMEAPAGMVPVSENVRVSPASASVAVAMKVSAASSFTLFGPMGPRTGVALA